MKRTEYYRDPQAPTANSIVVATSVFVQRDNTVLLIKRADNDLWSLPGGAQEIGETIAAAGVRETREETGIDVEIVGMVGIYSDPEHVVAYADGEVRQQFSVCLRGEYVRGEPTMSDEAADVRWADSDSLDTLAIHPSMRLRIDHGLANRAQPYIG